MRAWAFITKVFGVIATVCGGLASGKVSKYFVFYLLFI